MLSTARLDSMSCQHRLVFTAIGFSFWTGAESSELLALFMVVEHFSRSEAFAAGEPSPA